MSIPSSDETTAELQQTSIPWPDPSNWWTSSSYRTENIAIPLEAFLEANIFLLANPNLNSTHLFRADILFDSAGELQSPAAKEKEASPNEIVNSKLEAQLAQLQTEVQPRDAESVAGYALERTVVRRFIPRNAQLDRALDQTCHIYLTIDDRDVTGKDKSKLGRKLLIVSIPHVDSAGEMPWYHPTVRALAYLYEWNKPAEKQGVSTGIYSIHFQSFEIASPPPLPTRLHRTILSLVKTQIRLAKASPSAKKPDEQSSKPVKTPQDNIVLQHKLQNTYAVLKTKYAPDLIRDWVETTEPGKHVFEDICIAAFLIELWRIMYKVRPQCEKSKADAEDDASFPSFVDMACGNGVLVYLLNMEGYRGTGYDARQRKTWSIFPETIQANLHETICIPKPFIDALENTSASSPNPILEVQSRTHNGIFEPGTFIISNHADELTTWTPLLAALSNPESPCPFLAIPCCSHGLSGARIRYPPPGSKAVMGSPFESKMSTRSDHVSKKLDELDITDPDVDQPAEGDLKALRAAKYNTATTESPVIAGDKSAYSSLTTQVVRLASALEMKPVTTRLRIPSTRNIGIVCQQTRADGISKEERISRIEKSIEKQCAKILEGGSVENAARVWVERAKGLQQGQGRGKLKGGAAGH